MDNMNLRDAWNEVLSIKPDLDQLEDSEHLTRVQQAILYIGSRAAVEGEALDEGYDGVEVRFFKEVPCEREGCDYQARMYKSGIGVCTKCNHTWRANDA